MRTVRDPRGIMWICLELPEIPAELREARASADASADLVAIECNSGADRVVTLVQAGWDSDLEDAALADTIARAPR